MPAVNDVEARLQDPITQHLRTTFAKLQYEQTVGQALDSLRESPPKGRIIYFYVVDEDNKLKGIVPTRRLLLSNVHRRISDLIPPGCISIPHSASVLEACEFFMFHRYLAFPVVDDENHLLGIVDIELYTSEISDFDRKEVNDDLFQLIGIHLPDNKPSSPMSAFRHRFPWLLANIAGGILAAYISGLYEAELKKVVALALFIPVVLALAESVSIQSVTLTLQVLHHKPPTLKSLVNKIRFEATVGILLGISCGITVGIYSLIWLGQWAVVACLLGGIAGGVTCAAVLGVALPTLIRLFHREPQVAAGPIVLASTDMATLLIYFSLARWLLA